MMSACANMNVVVNDDCKYEDRLALLGIEDDSEPTST